MTKNKEDVLARAFATLSSLRKNIDQRTAYSVKETYVREFHAVLDKLEGVEIDVTEFRIPDSQVTPRVQIWNYGGGRDSYSKEKYVERVLILTKLDAILGYFEIITSGKPRRIGYHTPDKR